MTPGQARIVQHSDYHSVHAEHHGAVFFLAQLKHRAAGGISGHIYSAAKAAVIQLSRNVAAELAESGVRLNTISPGGIVTGIFAKSASVADAATADRVTAVVESKFATVQGLPRAGQTVDVAYAAVFLASDRGSFITGHDLVVDGGMVPFGTLGWKESIAMRAELARRIGAEVGQNA
jgi:NAD(P)-dependent dehydrogenase (short-subunit alcohol dehydrogenase family)